MWTVVCLGSLSGCRNSMIRRAPRSSRIAPAASSVRSQLLATRLANAGGSGPSSGVAGNGCTPRGRVARRASPYSPNHTATGSAPRPISMSHGFMAPPGHDGSEPDLDWAPFRLGGLEELLGPKAHHSGEDAGRQRLDRRVVRLHRAVVELPRVRDLVLGAGQLGLQRHEVLVRLQVRVRLGEGEQPAERLR